MLSHLAYIRTLLYPFDTASNSNQSSADRLGSIIWESPWWYVRTRNIDLFESRISIRFCWRVKTPILYCYSDAKRNPVLTLRSPGNYLHQSHIVRHNTVTPKSTNMCVCVGSWWRTQRVTIHIYTRCVSLVFFSFVLDGLWRCVWSFGFWKSLTMKKNEPNTNIQTSDNTLCWIFRAIRY